LASSGKTADLALACFGQFRVQRVNSFTIMIKTKSSLKSFRGAQRSMMISLWVCALFATL